MACTNQPHYTSLPLAALHIYPDTSLPVLRISQNINVCINFSCRISQKTRCPIHMNHSNGMFLFSSTNFNQEYCLRQRSLKPRHMEQQALPAKTLSQSADFQTPPICIADMRKSTTVLKTAVPLMIMSISYCFFKNCLSNSGLK